MRDLRILLDKSADREAELAAMVKMVMEERFYKPVITRDSSKPRQQAPMFASESLNDVSTFDDKADAARMKAGEELEREMRNEFNAIFEEHTEAHQEKEANATSA